MYDTRPYEQHPDQFHQCFEHLDHQTRCPETAIIGEYFCVHHRIQPSPIYIRPDASFHLNPLTDRDSIVQAASEIAYRVASKSLDEKRAGKLLYACQIANQALEGKLRDQKLALQQAKHAAAQAKPATAASHRTSPTASHPAPATALEVLILSEVKDPSSPPATHAEPPQKNKKCHPEPQAKDLSSSPAPEPQSAPTNSEPRHSEPQAQNLSISPTAEPEPPPTLSTNECTLAALHAAAYPRRPAPHSRSSCRSKPHLPQRRLAWKTTA